MSKNRAFGYVRISPKNSDQDNEIDAINSCFNELKLFREADIRGGVPAERRPALQEMLSQLSDGDHVVVWWIDSLGSFFGDILRTIATILERGASLHTVNQSLVLHHDCEQTQAQLQLLEGIAKAEKKRRFAHAEASRRALRENPEEWAKKFQGRKADMKLHMQIATLLMDGKTLQATAEETGASLSTVKRVKKKLKEKAELGDMGFHPKHPSHKI